MHRMTRAKAIEAIKAAGASGDQKAFLRLYTENSVSLQVAKDAFASGRRFAEFVSSRDAKS